MEEEILERAKRKMVLDHLVIQSMDLKGRAKVNLRGERNPDLSAKELDAILKFGAEDLFKDGDGDAAGDELELDDVLRRAETHDTTRSGAGEELLQQFKTVNVATDEDPRAWDDILPAATIAAAQREAAAAAAPQVLEPRVRKTTGYAPVEEVAEAGRGGKSKSKKKSKDGKDGKRGEYSAADVKAFVALLRRFGNVTTHLKEIRSALGARAGSDADVTMLASQIESACERAALKTKGGSDDDDDEDDGDQRATFSGVPLPTDLLRKRDDMGTVVAMLGPPLRVPVVRPPQWDLPNGQVRVVNMALFP